MNELDVVAIIVVAVTVVSGLRSGFLPQLGGLIGAALGGASAIVVLPLLRPYVEQLDPWARAVAVVAELLLPVAIGEAVGSALGAMVRSRIGQVLGTVDSWAGAALGAAQGLLVVWLVGGLLAAGPQPDLAAQAQRSLAVRALNETLPPPVLIAGELGHWLDASGLPEVFVGFEPFPAPPVDLPTDPQARRIATRAIASTVEVNSAACSITLAGTGFVIRPHYVITNAHVIAGAAKIWVTPVAGSHAATAVLFDPRLDIAVLYVPDLDAPSLKLATTLPERGATGTALGHPGGGPLAVIPGAVSATYRARGRDLSGESYVTREIVELRARIQRGDSGGPFVLADGTVGGVVFAQAKTDSSVGYALSPLEVAEAITPGLTLTTSVDTGACTR